MVKKNEQMNTKNIIIMVIETKNIGSLQDRTIL